MDIHVLSAEPTPAHGTAALELQLALLSQVASAMARDADAEQMRGHALSAAVAGTHARRGVVLMHDRTARVFWAATPAVGWTDDDALALSLAEGECFAVDSVFNGTASAIAHISSKNGPVPTVLRRAGAKTGLILPVWSGKDIAGVMCLMDKHEAFGEFADVDSAFVKTVLMQLSAGLRSARLRDYGARRGAARVSVLFSRGDFDEVVGMEIDRAERLGHALGCAMLEITNASDALKQHGRGAIDAIVKTVAEAVRQNMRQTDILIRYDESTVALIMPGTDTAGSKVVAARLADRLRCVDVSCGVCTYPEEAKSRSELVSTAVRRARGEKTAE